jgi:Raf kinase inhibitor-like YbhB/YbcL family protein
MIRTLALMSALALLASCGDGGGEAPAPGSVVDLGLRSSDFEDGNALWVELTCDGDGRSPALAWRASRSADSYVVTMTDEDADDFVHWVVWRIDGHFDGFESNGIPPGATEGTNDFGDRGYGPPCPPEGDEPHRYAITLYQIEQQGGQQVTEVPPASSLTEVLDSVACCVRGKDTITGTYERP